MSRNGNSDRCGAVLPASYCIVGICCAKIDLILALWKSIMAAVLCREQIDAVTREGSSLQAGWCSSLFLIHPVLC